MRLAITYDPEFGLAYITLKPRPDRIAKSIEVQRNVILDFDADGEVVGIELIGETLLDGLRKAGDVIPPGGSVP